MNIFFLSHNPQEAAQLQCDKHVVKMILETAQLLSTTHRLLDGDEKGQLPDPLLNETLYKATHKNHPCAKWVREGSANYIWLVEHFKALCTEYTYRYGKVHKTETLMRFLENIPKNIPKNSMVTNPPLAMPDEYKTADITTSYRNYYKGAKKEIATWKKRPTPSWMK